MAVYGTKYYAYVADDSGNTYTVNVKKLNYTGSSSQITDYSTTPLVLMYRGGRDDFENGKAIFPSSIRFDFYSKESDDFTELLNSEYKDYQLEISTVR